MTNLAGGLLGDRSLFPTLRAFAYCNHAAISPPSLPVQEGVNAALAHYAQEGLGAFISWQQRRQALRERCARLMGCTAADVAFTASTTRGISDIALSIPWRAGDRVVVFEGEFPTNVTPWQCAARLFQLELQWQRAQDFNSGQGLEVLERTLRQGARLVAVSAVQFQTGLRMPLGEIGKLCEKYGAELFVDAIQALGVMPLNVTDLRIDYLSCGTHKWLMGVEGAGLLYVRPERVKLLQPPVAGWLSHESAESFLREGPGHLRYDRPLKKHASVFEGSALNMLGFAALAPALDLLLDLGVERIFSHVQAYHDRLEPALEARGFTSRRSADLAGRSGSLSFDVPAGVSVAALHAALWEAGVSCSLPDGLLRFSPHWPNSLDEVGTLVGAVDAALERLSALSSR